jgi:hypothetical protein
MKRINLSVVLALVSLLIFPLGAKAQQDIGSIVGAEFNKSIGKKINLSVQEEWRTRENFGSPERFTTTVGLDYKLNTYFTAGGAYDRVNFHRTGSDNATNTGWEKRDRWGVYLDGHIQRDKWLFSLRETYQQTYTDGVVTRVTRNRINPQRVLRSRLEADYSMDKKWQPFASLEAFNPLNNPSNNDTEKLRFQLGTNMRLSKHSNVKIYYRYDAFLDKHLEWKYDIENGSYDGRHYIGIKYSLSF